MGSATEVLTLRNPCLPHLGALEKPVVVDAESTYLCIPESVCAELDLEAIDTRPVYLPDGTRRLVPYVGPVEVRFRNRTACCGALVMGEHVLLGAVPMRDLQARV